MENRKLYLSKRMKAVVEMVPPHSSKIADIGCDHAYVSIYLKKEKNADYVIAMDVRKGPLDIAKRNISEFGLDASIDVRLSDGLNELAPGEADTIIIAGMGGLLIKDILTRGADVLNASLPPVLILQPQSDIADVRIFLYSISYHIEQEKMVFEDGKYYTVIRALPGKDKCYSLDEELVYGRCNILNRDDTLIRYLENEERVILDIIAGLEDALKKNEGKTQENVCDDPKYIRINELKKRLIINRKAYGRCKK